MIARFRTFFALKPDPIALRDRETALAWQRARAAVEAKHPKDRRGYGEAIRPLKDALNARLDFEVSRGGRA